MFKSFAVAAIGFVFSAGVALAGPTYTFATSTGVQPADVGVVTVSQFSANTVEVLVDLKSSTYGFINTGGPHTPFAFNIAGTEAGISALFLTPVAGTYAFGMFSLSTTDGGATPFGTYGISINSTAGNGSSNGYFGDLKFQVTRTSGLSTDDFTKNTTGPGYYFAADLSNGTDTGSQAWASKSTTNVPEPASIALLSAGLVGLGMRARRRRS